MAERHEGDATTDFGAPSIILDADRAAVDLQELSNWQSVLQACWSVFDSAARRAMGRGLRKGPRGGGRGVQQIIDHILQADQAYMARLAWRRRRQGEIDSVQQLHRTRQLILDALNAAAAGDLPETGLRGGRVWSPRFYGRRVAWHVLDHAWEIEDRMV